MLIWGSWRRKEIRLRVKWIKMVSHWSSAGLRPVGPTPRRGSGIWLERPLWNKVCTMSMFLGVWRTGGSIPGQQGTWGDVWMSIINDRLKLRNIWPRLKWYTTKRVRANTMLCGEKNTWKRFMARDTWKTDWGTIWHTIPRGGERNDNPHYGLKEHASVDIKNGFVLATTMTPASASGPTPSHRDYVPVGRASSPEGWAVLWVESSIWWPPARGAYGSERAYRARFTTIVKNIWDAMCRQTCPVKCEAYFSGMAFNLFRGSKILATA